jgi:plastocyanin
MKKIMMASVALAMTAVMAHGAQAAEYVISLKDHQFTPSDLVIPAGEKVSITVKNDGTRMAEFESHELKREKVISAGKQAVITVGPLAAGTYPYFDEFSGGKAKGTITVK